jgi:hypothetical protein
MRPSFCAKFDGCLWIAQTNDPANGQYDLVATDWPEGQPIPPHPRFGPGARIRFKWGNGYLTGTIIEVRSYFDILPGINVYEVREIAHRRTLYDDGKTEITVQKK